MKTTTISGKLRSSIGGKDAKALRKEGLVPCVIYGGDENVHVAIDSRAFNDLVYTPDVYRVKVDVEGTEYDTIFYDQQFDPISDEITHADFLKVDDNKVVTVNLPLKFQGSPIGVRNGGKLRTPLRKLKIKGAVSAIPDDIELDITNLRIGRSIKVGDIKLDGVQILNDDNNVAVAVKMARGAVDDEEEEGEEAEEAAEASAE
jgi:large subunit ribosomal protein L25